MTWLVTSVLQVIITIVGCIYTANCKTKCSLQLAGSSSYSYELVSWLLPDEVDKKYTYHKVSRTTYT